MKTRDYWVKFLKHFIQVPFFEFNKTPLSAMLKELRNVGEILLFQIASGILYIFYLLVGKLSSCPWLGRLSAEVRGPAISCFSMFFWVATKKLDQVPVMK